MPPSPQPLYLTGEHEPVFATLHRPAEPQGGTAVLLCPPFGWEEVCAYRGLRFWADSLAAAGHPALRLSLPATGDSAGDPRDPDRVGAWTRSVCTAAAWLRTELSGERLAAIGIGLGGLVCLQATAAGAGIDELVLWAVPSRGRTLVRELRAFSRLAAERFYEGVEAPVPSSPDKEGLEAGGFLLSEETVQALEQLDVAAGSATVSPRRALLLERDGIAPEERLRAHLEASGLQVEVAPGDGYGAMTSHPQRALPPQDVIARVNRWLGQRGGPGERFRSARTPPGARSDLLVQMDGQVLVRETPVTLSHHGIALPGVLAEPVDRAPSGVCAVLYNAGAVRRIGPSRMYVECSRRWARLGVTTLRYDLEGIGDAPGTVCPYPEDPDFYDPRLLAQAHSALDHLQSEGVGDRFVLGGLCSGAYWSFQGLVRDPRVRAALVVNPGLLVWRSGLGPARDLRTLLTEPLSLARLRQVASVERTRTLLAWMLAAPVRAAATRARGRSSEAATAQRELQGALETLRRSERRMMLVFAEHEPVFAELERAGLLRLIADLPNVTVERIAVRDHTLRPLWAQSRAHEILDRAIVAQLTAEAIAPDAVDS